jgi:hypothetical protein
MTTTSLPDVQANATGQPPITPGGGLFSTDWLPGSSAGTQSPVVVSFTDFHSHSDEDWQQIAQLGMKLADSWPIMGGAVGLPSAGMAARRGAHAGTARHVSWWRLSNTDRCTSVRWTPWHRR